MNRFANISNTQLTSIIDEWIKNERDRNLMKSYPVQAGQSALLMDTETNCFGIKTVDASGMPLPLRLFDYKERTQNASQSPVTPVTDTSVFITREEFESRLAAITAATERIESDAE